MKAVWVSGEILDSKSEPGFQFEGKQGDVIWVGKDPDCTDSVNQGHPVFFWLMDPSSKRLDLALEGCVFGRRELPFRGTYTMKGVFKYRNEITRYRVPIRFIRHDRQQPVSFMGRR